MSTPAGAGARGWTCAGRAASFGEIRLLPERVMDERPGRPCPPSPPFAGTGVRVLGWLIAVAALAAGPVAAAAQEAERSDTVPEYLERIRANRATGVGIALTRDDLMDLGVSDIGQAVDRVVRQPYRTRQGRECTPAVYWNGMKIADTYPGRDSMLGGTSLSGVLGMELYAQYWEGGVPSAFGFEECGVIALWVDNTAGGPDEGSTSMLAKVGLVLLAGVIAFLTVGSL